MNNILELKGKRFIQEAKPFNGMNVSIKGDAVVLSRHLISLKTQLENIKNFWESTVRPFKDILISVHYNKIVAKSNRINGLFKGQKSNYAIVGAKFNNEQNKHIITYLISTEDINNSIQLLKSSINILEKNFSGEIDKKKFEDDELFKDIVFSDNDFLTENKFKQVIADVSYIELFSVDKVDNKSNFNGIVTLYNVGTSPQKLLNAIGINIFDKNVLDDQTVYLDKMQYEVLCNEMPYLISMSTEDFLNLSPDNFISSDNEKMITIPSPTTEPTIGVIDTLFDSRVYFSEWVEYHELIDKEIPTSSEDYRHGTGISSIIVDGPRLNPWLDDECGRFRVRHFGISLRKGFSAITFIQEIQSIIKKNLDIRVWNISLGSNSEINPNSISIVASILDKIQFDYNVIFVIAGTNKRDDKVIKIGSPADSINSVVVNSVRKDKAVAEYSRRGPVLSFFAKPDVSYYGGSSSEKYIKVCEPLGEQLVSGTSYAAPWIARKLSYLIDVLGFNREVAKAILIDSARGWEEPSFDNISFYGHGIVPIKMSDIIQTPDNEIKFVVSDVSEKWNTYNYFFPVPLNSDNKYPYIARATMCYFPLCNRMQGVDYTNTELDLHFGRITDEKKLKDIKSNKQNEESDSPLLEKDARKKFRKWDNVKYIIEDKDKRHQAKKSYTNKNWGMEVKTNNRLDIRDGEGIRFGIVVTLRAIDEKNRIDEFIRNCTLNGWLTYQIDVKNKIEIHQKINEEIEFE